MTMTNFAISEPTVPLQDIVNPRIRPALTAVVLMAFLILISAVGQNAHALKSDREQPATIDADDVELDFKTGARTYTGNVTVRQGTMNLTCDRLVATFENDQLSIATAYGSAENPAVFKQRPEGKDYDVVGKAETMVLDHNEQLVTLAESASLKQGTDTITGNKILYDMELEKMRVKGSQTTIQKPKKDEAAPADTSSQPSGSADPPPASSDTDATAAADSLSTTGAVVGDSMTDSEPVDDPVLSRGTQGRPRIVIEPRSRRSESN